MNRRAALDQGKCPCGHAAADRGAGGDIDVVTTMAFGSWRIAVERGFAFPAERLALQLMGDSRVGRLVVAEPYRSPAGRARDVAARHDFPADEHTRLVAPVQVAPRWGETPEAEFRRYDRKLLAAADRLGMRRPRLIATDPVHAAVADASRWGAITYYAWDDWSVHGAYQRDWETYARAYSAIRASGIAVCAVTERLLATIAPTGPSLVVPNGVRPDEWEATGPAPDWYDALPRPRLVYAGAIGDRLDVRELERLADAFPDGTVALIGPITSKPIFAALRRRPNVVIAPNQDRDTIRGILAASDVGIMPHVVTPLTLTMSPLKVFEYIAAGIPAVATDLPPVRDLHDRIASVPVGGDFVGAVRAALARGRVLDEERQRLFREHCWHGRFEALLAVALREPDGG